MKTFFSLIAGLIATTASFSSFAQTAPAPTPQMLVTVADNKVRVLVGEENSKALVTIMDEAGVLVYSESANIKHGLRESLDLSGLDEGMYQLAVSTNEGLVTKTIHISEKPAQRTVAFVDNHSTSPSI